MAEGMAAPGAEAPVLDVLAGWLRGATGGGVLGAMRARGPSDGFVTSLGERLRPGHLGRRPARRGGGRAPGAGGAAPVRGAGGALQPPPGAGGGAAAPPGQRTQP